MLPAAIIEIMLPIVVAEDELVDRLRAIVEGADQRLADRVPERSRGIVADRDAAEAQVRDMCEKLLANTVIESYRVEIA